LDAWPSWAWCGCWRGFYGAVLLNAGLQHLIYSDRIANYIGWAPGSGFQLELGWGEVGLGCASLLVIRFRGIYVLGPAIVGSVLLLGAAFVHARDVAKRGNLSPGNAGAVFYIDLLVPILVAALVALYRPWALQG
jgi:hypothetical protein